MGCRMIRRGFDGFDVAESCLSAIVYPAQEGYFGIFPNLVQEFIPMSGDPRRSRPKSWAVADFAVRFVRSGYPLRPHRTKDGWTGDVVAPPFSFWVAG